MPDNKKEYIETSLGLADTFGASADSYLDLAKQALDNGLFNDADTYTDLASAYLQRAAIHQKNAEIELYKITLGVSVYE